MSYLPHAFLVLMAGASLLAFATSERLNAAPPVAEIASALSMDSKLVRACFDAVPPPRGDIRAANRDLVVCLQSYDQSLSTDRVLDVLMDHRPGPQDH